MLIKDQLNQLGKKDCKTRFFENRFEMTPTHLPNEYKEDISEATAKSEKEETCSKSLGK